MKKSHLRLGSVAVFFFTVLWAAHAQQPTPLLTQPAEKLIAIIQSDASQKEKVDACRQLAVIGTKEAVPALTALLSDEKMNHMARYALETIPDPSVDLALRAVLPQLQGRPLVGVIGSIGVRRDAQAVPSLAQLLGNSDPDVAQAAARTLGTIANPAAIEALRTGLPKTSTANQVAFCEGLLRAAEKLAKSDPKEANAIYEQLRKVEGPHQVRVAAIRGAILTKGSGAASLLRDELRSTDYLTFAAAVRTSYEVPAADVTKALAAELPHLADDNRKILVIEALAKRPDSPALPALAEAAKNGSSPVRGAATRALAETGNPAAAPMLADLLNANDAEISQAALDGLAGLKGSQADATVQSMLQGRDSVRRLAAIELVGRRRMVACMPDLLKAATDPDAKVRPAALSKVGDLGSTAEVVSVLDILPKLSGSADLNAAEQTLSTLCGKSDHPESCTPQLAARLAQAPPPQKAVLLQVLSSVGGASALQTVRDTLSDTNPEVHGAAVRALGAWKTADAAPDLLLLAKRTDSPTDQTLGLRSYLGMAANPDVPADERLTMCRNATGIVKSTEDKRLLLSALGSIDSPESVSMIMPYLDDPAIKDEASAAVAGIAERMLKDKKNPAASKLVEPLEKVVKVTANEELGQRAKSLLQQARKAAQNSQAR